MTLVANDPSLWPLISLYRSGSYVVVASFAAVVYDWVLTLGQEVELIWRQRWSLMTVLYLIIRYTGIIFVIIDTLWSLPSISHTDAGCGILDYTTNWTDVVIAAMLGVIVIARLYAMYHGSRKMLISLVVIFLAVNIGCAVITAIGGKYIVAEEFILSGTYQCITSYEGNVPLLIAMVWMLNTVWEVLTLCLSLWIVVKHIRDSRRLRPSTRLNIGDCFTMLIKSHVIYFTSFLAVSCFNLGGLSAAIADSGSIGAEIYYSLLKIFSAVQLFVLGPRLILSVREYNAKLVADSNVETGMTSIAFQERVHVSTSSSV